jgi:hypothetical protein
MFHFFSICACVYASGNKQPYNTKKFFFLIIIHFFSFVFDSASRSVGNRLNRPPVDGVGVDLFLFVVDCSAASTCSGW